MDNGDIAYESWVGPYFGWVEVENVGLDVGTSHESAHRRQMRTGCRSYSPEPSACRKASERVDRSRCARIAVGRCMAGKERRLLYRRGPQVHR